MGTLAHSALRVREATAIRNGTEFHDTSSGHFQILLAIIIAAFLRGPRQTASKPDYDALVKHASVTHHRALSPPLDQRRDDFTEYD